MRETHIIPIPDTGKDDKFIIYRPLLGLAFIGNRSMANFALELAGLPEEIPVPPDSEAVRFLTNIGFFLHDTIPVVQPDYLSVASLLVTNRCQLRCGYCYAAAGSFSPKTLKFETAKTVIDAICNEAIKNNLPEFRVEFHGGGEPSLAWSLLTRVVEYARSKPLYARISITSNAMWSKNQCEWLSANLDSMSISMDGNERIQNRNRPRSSGAPSFPTVMRNLKFLDNRKFPYGIRMTAVPPWEDLVSNIKFLVEETTCKGIQVEPAFNTARGEHGTPITAEVGSFVEAFQEAYLIAKNSHIDLRYAGARPGIVTRRFCSAPYNALVVNPDDGIVTCYEVVNSQHNFSSFSNIGRVENGQILMANNPRKKLYSLLEERFEKCSGCFCRWSCAGDCYVRVFQPDPEGHLAFGERCEINRRITIFLLLNMISDSGGVWKRSQYIPEREYYPHG